MALFLRSQSEDDRRVTVERAMMQLQVCEGCAKTILGLTHPLPPSLDVSAGASGPVYCCRANSPTAFAIFLL